jgi:NAD-dependent deacetylase
MKKIVIISGAGISKESGISTFRDNDGLWRKHRFEDLASPEAWARNPQLVMDFYNQRRKQLFEVDPNPAHYALVELEKKFDVQVITQNVDDLHERAGSNKVIHLHGELKKVRSTSDESLVYTMDQWELKLGDTCELGSQLRPHIVWFGEPVPMIGKAMEEMYDADIVLIIGTSLFVYPAAGLINYAPKGAKCWYIDPNASEEIIKGVNIIKEKAGDAIPKLVKQILDNED